GTFGPDLVNTRGPGVRREGGCVMLNYHANFANLNIKYITLFASNPADFLTFQPFFMKNFTPPHFLQNIILF
ncbi:MAG TPA: hypothetical protein PKH43_07955, partial [Saprospiraceae bacterium]|nr:hypothetical protein [Saprospiraceae bacterium]